MSANNYITTSNLYSLFNISTQYDSLLDSLCSAASRAVDYHTGRKPGAYYVTTESTLYFDGSGHRTQAIYEFCAAPSLVAVAETGKADTSPTSTDGTYTTWASTDYFLYPYNAPETGKPYTQLHVNLLTGTKVIFYRFPKSVKVTAKFGYSTDVPAPVYQACLAYAVHEWKRAIQNYGDMSAIPELGQLMFSQALPPEASLIIERYNRVGI